MCVCARIYACVCVCMYHRVADLQPTILVAGRGLKTMLVTSLVKSRENTATCACDSLLSASTLPSVYCQFCKLC